MKTPHIADSKVPVKQIKPWNLRANHYYRKVRHLFRSSNHSLQSLKPENFSLSLSLFPLLFSPSHFLQADSSRGASKIPLLHNSDRFQVFKWRSKNLKHLWSETTQQECKSMALNWSISIPFAGRLSGGRKWSQQVFPKGIEQAAQSSRNREETNNGGELALFCFLNQAREINSFIGSLFLSAHTLKHERPAPCL